MSINQSFDLIWLFFLSFTGSQTFWHNYKPTMVYQKLYVKSLERNALLIPQKTCNFHITSLFFQNNNAVFIFHCRCNIDNKNLMPFQLLLVVGTFFLVLAVLASFYLKKIAPKKLVCKYTIF